MSKNNVIAFIRHLENHDLSGNMVLKDPDPETLIALADGLGFRFTEDDLKSVLNTRICNAEGLPRPWGWVLARKFGLVRN